MMRFAFRWAGGVVLGLSVVAFGASPAFAHINPQEHGSFLSGFTHPLFGVDHVLAMVAAGLWAVMLGGRAVWGIPAAFAGMMAVGYGLGVGGLALPFVEPAILTSVVVLGLVIAAAVQLPAAVGGILIGAFALFHGHAHAAELGAANAASYFVGFMLATIMLLAAGMGIARSLKAGSEEQTHALPALRTFGGAIALTGVFLTVMG